jgi:NAD(P)-dependent dehydrogenase (short-subunit alcohol dehydrogenase family)
VSNFADQAAVVTGAAQGIGRGIAERLVADGAHVVLFDIDGDLVGETAAALGDRAMAVAGDVARRADVARAVTACTDAFGRLDLMVAHAGISHGDPLLDLDDATWDRVMGVNLFGTFYCTQEAGRAMVAGGHGGSIVITSSINSFYVEENLSAYNTSKGAIDAFIRSAAMDLARHGIRVNGVSPGVVNTRISRWVIEDPVLGPRYLKTIPIRRFGEPADIAGVVSFLASDDAGYVTGQTLVIDGGQTLGIPLDDAPTVEGS